MKLSSQTQSQLKAALREDIGSGDVTSKFLVPAGTTGDAFVFAKEKGVFCGECVILELLRIADPKLKVRFFVKDGDIFRKNKEVLEIKGKLRSILKTERTLLNFMARLCGIATITNSFVKRVAKYDVQVLDTRKTTPLWRELEKYAVRVGGGKNHRMGLYDDILVKENHRCGDNLKKLKQLSRRVVIEARDFSELREAIELNPYAILLDNFSPWGVRKAAQLTKAAHPHILLEASGGITLANAARYAASGVDRISVGSLTHSVKSLDFSLLLK